MKTNHRVFILALGTLLCAVLFVAHCGNAKTLSAFEKAAADVEGIYEVHSRTRNEVDCNQLGQSVLTEEGDSYFYVKAAKIFGLDYLAVSSCSSADNCRERVASMGSFELVVVDFGYTLGLFANGVFSGEGAATGFGHNGVCEDGETNATSLTKSGDHLTIRKEITVAAPYPADADGHCTTGGAREAVQGQSCTQLEVLEGILDSAL